MKNNYTDMILKIIIIVLFYLGVLFSASVILKSNILTIQSSNKSYTIQKKLPTKIHQTEVIVPPTLGDVLPTAIPSNSNVIGSISIKSVNLILPIFSGVSNEHLLFGAVNLFPERTPSEDNLVLAGHNIGYFGELFSPILNVNLGEKILINYLGEVFTYVVKETKIISESEINILETDERTSGQLTLITCDTPDETSKRFIILADLSERVDEGIMRDYNVHVQRKFRTYLPISCVFFILIIGTFYIFKYI